MENRISYCDRVPVICIRSCKWLPALSTMKKIFLFSSIILSITPSLAQLPELRLSNDVLNNKLTLWNKDSSISVDSIATMLAHWDDYPTIEKTGQDYLLLFNDIAFGEVPFKIFIPPNYKNTQTTPLLLMLHGAVGRSSFENAYRNNPAAEDDFFFQYFSKQGFIIVRPFGDVPRRFDWVANRFNSRNNNTQTNKTYNTLENVIFTLKKIVNIDDSKVFAFGFSDGADGAFALDMYKPSLFAGFVAYNSILTNIFTWDIYYKNTVNRPLYLIHSDNDEIRPVQQTRQVMKSLDSLQAPVLYKEYIGYRHFDNHLEKDLPYSSAYLHGLSRNCFPKSIYWETDDYNNNTCDWMRITQMDTTLDNAKWHKEMNVKSYNRDNGTIENMLYLGRLNQSAAVVGNCNNNIFDIQTSRVKELEILINPVMVNMDDPVTVNINGKEMFKGKVRADKTFMINNFAEKFDRQALWMASIKIKVKCKRCD